MRYHLDSMLPMRAFSPRSGRARGFSAGGMTLEGSYNEPAQSWQDPDAFSPPAWSPEPEAAAPAPGPAPDQGGGGGVDQGTLDRLYSENLNRTASGDTGSSGWLGKSVEEVLAGIRGSQEYANNQGGGSSPAPSSGGVDQGTLDRLYTENLGRTTAGDTGSANWLGKSAEEVLAGIKSSQEYANRSGGGGGAAIPSTAEINAYYRQYLNRDADQGGVSTWTGKTKEEILAGITGSQEYQNANPGAPVLGTAAVTPDDPSQWIPQVSGTEYHGDSEPTHTYQYMDPKTGNIYDSQSAEARLIISGEAAKDKYLSPLVWMSNEEKQALYSTKTEDPKKYYSNVATELEKQLFLDYRTNSNTSDSYNALQALKEVAPQDYYKAQLTFLAKQAGWQTGQNTSERAAPVLEEMKKVGLEAQYAGVKFDDVKSIVNNGFATANAQNQQRIAREGAEGGGGFNFGKDVMPGVAIIGIAAATVASAGAAAPLGAAMLGTTAAAAVGATATAALGGLVIGAGMGALTAAVYGGNIEQGAIKGAISGTIGGAASGFTTQATAAIQAAELAQATETASKLIGFETISAIANATSLSTTQVASIIANTTATAIAAAATGQVDSSNFAQTIATALASSAVSEYALDIANKINPGMSVAAINAVSSVARIATTTTLNGGSVQKAIITNIPAIINGSVGAEINAENRQNALNIAVSNKSNDPIETLNSLKDWTGKTSDNADNVVNMMISAGYKDKDILSTLQRNFGLDSQSALMVFNDMARLPDKSLVFTPTSLATPTDTPLGTNPFGSENVGLTSGSIDSVLQRGPDILPQNEEAWNAAVQSGDQQLINAVRSNNPDVIKAINSGDMIGAIALAPETSGVGTVSPAVRDAYNAALETGDKQLINAVQAGNTKVIEAIRNGDMIGAIGLAPETSGVGTLSPTARDAYQKAVANKETSFTADGKTYTLDYSKATSDDAGTSDKSFNQAFSDARKSGASRFEWNGKQYTTQLAPRITPESSPIPPNKNMFPGSIPGDTYEPIGSLKDAFAPKTKSFQEAIDFAKDVAPILKDVGGYYSKEQELSDIQKNIVTGVKTGSSVALYAAGEMSNALSNVVIATGS